MFPFNLQVLYSMGSPTFCRFFCFFGFLFLLMFKPLQTSISQSHRLVTRTGLAPPLQLVIARWVKPPKKYARLRDVERGSFKASCETAIAEGHQHSKCFTKAGWDEPPKGKKKKKKKKVSAKNLSYSIDRANIAVKEVAAKINTILAPEKNAGVACVEELLEAGRLKRRTPLYFFARTLLAQKHYRDMLSVMQDG